MAARVHCVAAATDSQKRLTVAAAGLLSCVHRRGLRAASRVSSNVREYMFGDSLRLALLLHGWKMEEDVTRSDSR